MASVLMDSEGDGASALPVLEGWPLRFNHAQFEHAYVASKEETTTCSKEWAQLFLGLVIVNVCFVRPLLWGAPLISLLSVGLLVFGALPWLVLHQPKGPIANIVGSLSTSLLGRGRVALVAWDSMLAKHLPFVFLVALLSCVLLLDLALYQHPGMMLQFLALSLVLHSVSPLSVGMTAVYSASILALALALLVCGTRSSLIGVGVYAALLAQGCGMGLSHQKDKVDRLLYLKLSLMDLEHRTQVHAAFVRKICLKIRIPLTSILGFTQLFQETVEDEDQLEVLQVILDSARSLQDTAGNLEYFSNINDCHTGSAENISKQTSDADDERVAVLSRRGSVAHRLATAPSGLLASMQEFKSECFDLICMIDGVYMFFARQARLKGITLDLSVTSGLPPLAMGDPDATRHVLITLMHNAIAHAPFQGVVRLAVRLIPRPQPGDISDSGFSVESKSQNQQMKDFRKTSKPDARTHVLMLEVCNSGVPVSDALAKTLSLDNQPQARPEEIADYCLLKPDGGDLGISLTVTRHLVHKMGGSFVASKWRDDKVGKQATLGQRTHVDDDLVLGSRFWFTLLLPTTSSPGRRYSVGASIARKLGRARCFFYLPPHATRSKAKFTEEIARPDDDRLAAHIYRFYKGMSGRKKFCSRQAPQALLRDLEEELDALKACLDEQEQNLMDPMKPTLESFRSAAAAAESRGDAAAVAAAAVASIEAEMKLANNSGEDAIRPLPSSPDKSTGADTFSGLRRMRERRRSVHSNPEPLQQLLFLPYDISSQHYKVVRELLVRHPVGMHVLIVFLRIPGTEPVAMRAAMRKGHLWTGGMARTGCDDEVEDDSPRRVLLLPSSETALELLWQDLYMSQTAPTPRTKRPSVSDTSDWSSSEDGKTPPLPTPASRRTLSAGLVTPPSVVSSPTFFVGADNQGGTLRRRPASDVFTRSSSRVPTQLASPSCALMRLSMRRRKPKALAVGPARDENPQSVETSLKLHAKFQEVLASVAHPVIEQAAKNTAAAVKAAGFARPKSLASNTAGRRILVVEDNPSNQALLLAILRKEGFSCTVVKNGRECVDLVEAAAKGCGERPDLILMDLHMPEMDGFEATNVLRAMPFSRGLPIIAVTGSVSQASRRRCFDVGMNDFIAKPIKRSLLMTKVEQFCTPSPSSKSKEAPNLRIDLHKRSRHRRFASDSGVTPRAFALSSWSPLAASSSSPLALSSFLAQRQEGFESTTPRATDSLTEVSAETPPSPGVTNRISSSSSEKSAGDGLRIFPALTVDLPDAVPLSQSTPSSPTAQKQKDLLVEQKQQKTHFEAARAAKIALVLLGRRIGSDSESDYPREENDVNDMQAGQTAVKELKAPREETSERASRSHRRSTHRHSSNSRSRSRRRKADDDGRGGKTSSKAPNNWSRTKRGARLPADKPSLEKQQSLRLKMENELLKRDKLLLQETLKVGIIKPPSAASVVTLLFTDIQGSTTLWEAFPHLMNEAQKLHDQCVRECIAICLGYEVTTEGDAFQVAFHKPFDAIKCCLLARERLLDVKWPAEMMSHPDAVDVFQARPNKEGSERQYLFHGLRVRMGVHTGLPDFATKHRTTHRTQYFGDMVNVAHQLESMASGGQILVSEDTWQGVHGLIDQLGNPEVLDLGQYTIKSSAHAVRVFQLSPWHTATSYLAAHRHSPVEEGDSVAKVPFPPISLVKFPQKSPSFWDAPFPALTLVFVDLRDTQSLRQGSAVLLKTVIEKVCPVVRETVTLFNGYECQEDGGCFMLAFHSPMQAVECCVVIQIGMLNVKWPPKLTAALSAGEGTGKLRLSMGVLSGTCIEGRPHNTTGRMDYFGPIVNRCARVCAAAAPGQILVGDPSYKEIQAILESQQAVRDKRNGGPASRGLRRGGARVPRMDSLAEDEEGLRTPKKSSHADDGDDEGSDSCEESKHTPRKRPPNITVNSRPAVETIECPESATFCTPVKLLRTNSEAAKMAARQAKGALRSCAEEDGDWDEEADSDSDAAAEWSIDFLDTGVHSLKGVAGGYRLWEASVPQIKLAQTPLRRFDSGVPASPMIFSLANAPTPMHRSPRTSHDRGHSWGNLSRYPSAPVRVSQHHIISPSQTLFQTDRRDSVDSGSGHRRSRSDGGAIAGRLRLRARRRRRSSCSSDLSTRSPTPSPPRSPSRSLRSRSPFSQISTSLPPRSPPRSPRSPGSIGSRPHAPEEPPSLLTCFQTMSSRPSSPTHRSFSPPTMSPRSKRPGSACSEPARRWPSREAMLRQTRPVFDEEVHHIRAASCGGRRERKERGQNAEPRTSSQSSRPRHRRRLSMPLSLNASVLTILADSAALPPSDDDVE